MENFPKTLQLPDINSVLSIDIAQPEDAQEIGDFIGIHFDPRSPICHLHQYDFPAPGSAEAKANSESFIQYLRTDCLSTSCSLIVRDQMTKQLAAILLCNEVKKNSEPPVPATSLCFAILEALPEGFDLFTLYETDKIMEIFMVVVAQPFTKRGLATKLMQCAIELAARSGAGAIQMEAVSDYSARAALKFGFTSLKSIDYATFEYNGIKPLAENRELLAEHPTAHFMVRRLP